MPKQRIGGMFHSVLKPRAFAFTLVELLVVIGILGLLAAVLLSSTVAVKSSARKAVCVGNQKQLALAWQLYLTDNNDQLVPNRLVGLAGIRSPPNWVQGSFNFPPDTVNEDLLLDSEHALFAQYISAKGVYKCPADKSTVSLGRPPHIIPTVRSYSLNWFLGAGDDFPEFIMPRVLQMRKMSEITDPAPAKCILFVEVMPESICWPLFMIGIQSGVETEIMMYPGSFHNGRSVVSFADGHIETKKWVDLRTLEPDEQVSFHTHNEHSPNNIDVHWLQSRTIAQRFLMD